jgi:hypothetical protein
MSDVMKATETLPTTILKRKHILTASDMKTIIPSADRILYGEQMGKAIEAMKAKSVFGKDLSEADMAEIVHRRILSSDFDAINRFPITNTPEVLKSGLLCLLDAEVRKAGTERVKETMEVMDNVD